MNKKPLVIIVIASLIALISAPLLTSSATAQEADEIQGMRKALNSTVKQCGLSVYQGLDGQFSNIYYYFVARTDFGQYTYVGIDIRIFPSAEDAEDEYEMYGWIHSPVGTRKVTSFHGYPAETAYSISEPVWFEKTKTWEGYHSENYSLFWLADNYLFQIVVDAGDPETSAENLCQNVAEALFSNMQEQGLLAEGKPPEEENQPPNASFSIFPPSPTPDDSVSFCSTSTDPDGDPLTYKWYLDGNYRGDFPSCEPGKLAAGKHTIKLDVADGEGGTDSWSRTIIVGEFSVKISALPSQVTIKKDEKSKLTLKVTVTDYEGSPVNDAWVSLKVNDPQCLITFAGGWETPENKYTKNGVVTYTITFPELTAPSIAPARFPTHVLFTANAGKAGEDWKASGERLVSVFAELLEIVEFTYSPKPQIGELKRPIVADSDYTIRVRIEDESDTKSWSYSLATQRGTLTRAGASPSGSPKRIFFDSTDMKVDIKWHTPPKGVNLDDLSFAKKIYAINKAYARNLGVTGLGTIPVYGRFIKLFNDIYNLYDGIATTVGFAGKAWRDLKRGEIIAAVIHYGNAKVELMQTTLGGILLVPKAVAPPGLKEWANLCSDTVNAGIDHLQAGCEQFAEWKAPAEEKIMFIRLVAKVKNQEGVTDTEAMIVQFVYWEWE